MPIRYPCALRPGDRVGVTTPSSGVPSELRPRLDFCINFLRDKGFDVVLGSCVDHPRYVSAPAADRAAELSEMLVDPTIHAVIPPWGGELAIDLLPHLPWAQIAASTPTWFVGFSDISTLITPLTLRTGIATLHGNNLMDTDHVPRRVSDTPLTGHGNFLAAGTESLSRMRLPPEKSGLTGKVSTVPRFGRATGARSLGLAGRPEHGP